MQILAHIFGRSPKSVVDYACELRQEDSLSHDAVVQHRVPELPLPLDLHDCKGFEDLPDELLEIIFRKLESSSRKNFFAICGVSRSWRALGQRLFFSNPWNAPHLICHPNQLFCLSPRIPTRSRSGLLRCHLRREHLVSGTIASRRLTMHIGKDPQQTHRSRFLLCAVQRNRYETLVYLNSKCEGIPCARLSKNLLSTKYSLTLDSSITVSPTLALSTTAPSKKQHDDNNNDDGGGDNNNDDGGGDNYCDDDDDDDGNDDRNDIANASRGVPRDAIASPEKHRHHHDNCLKDRLEDSAQQADTMCHPSAVPSHLFSLHYKARIKGLMQPRKMSVSLPHADRLLCRDGSLPMLVQHGSVDHIKGNGSPTGHPAWPCSSAEFSSGIPGAPRGSSVQQSPFLDRISSVAVLELPPPTTEASSTAPATATTTTTTNDPTDTEVSATHAASSNGTTARGPLLPASTTHDALLSIATTEHHKHRVMKLMKLASFLHVASLFQRAKTNPCDGEDLLPITLSNKSPHWNEALRCWCLNFRGRVKLASVKNFQLVLDDDETQKVVMQFGKLDQDTFILDFNPTVVSAVQAFGIALSTFDGKVML